MKTYVGGCHCGKVRYEVETELKNLISCNCSHCQKKGVILDFVDKAKFKLLSGKEFLTDYFFNKKSIRHTFCKVCGIQAFGEGISTPKVAINVNTIDDIDTSKLEVSRHNGKDV